MTLKAPSQTAFRYFLYGSAAVLLVFDVFFLLRALLTTNFVPIVPLLAGIFTAGGLLFVIYAEGEARGQDKREHRRISRVAHQLDRPLSALQKDLVHLIATSDKLPAEARLKLKHMETRTHILLDNIRDVFLMLQAQDLPVSAELRTYNVCSILSDVIAEMEPLAAAKNVELLHSFHCLEAPVKIDRHLLKIVLVHLIENASTYTPTPGSVNIAITKSDKQVRIAVQDRGIGINDEEASSIFEPFARGERASGYDPDGIGVGLTLSQLIVEEFGGHMRWKNRAKGMGTQFEVLLPLAK